MDGPFGEVTEPDGNRRIGLGLESLGGVVAHLDDLGRGNDVEPLGGATLRGEHGPDLLLAAEEDDTALGTDGLQRHDSALDRGLGSEITAHGVYTYL